MALTVPTIQASADIQALKFTETSLGLGVTVTYKSDGVPHEATVKLSPPNSRNIIVHIGDDTTAQEIMDAVNSHVEASRLVVVTATDNPELVQRSCVETPLAGGTLAVTATAQLGPIRFTAKASGTAGNDVRVKYVAGGSLSVAVENKDISITVVDGVTKASAAAKAVNDNVDAKLLVKAKSSGGSLPVVVAHAEDFVSLSGGLNATNPYKLIQNVGFGKSGNGTSGNGYKITYVPDGTAGSETVEFGSHEMKIHIENGVSTANQVVAAVMNDPENTVTWASTTITITDYTQLSGVTFIVNGNEDPLVEGGDWDAITSNNVTASSLANFMNNYNDVDAVAVGNVVTVTAAELIPGTAGNAITLSHDATAGLTLASPTLTGGVDGYYAIAFSGSQAQITVNGEATSGASAPGGTAFNMSSAERSIKEDYFEYQFGFKPSYLKIKNTDVGGPNTLVLSFDGVNVAATLAAGEEYIATSDVVDPTSIPHCILMKYGTAAPEYTIGATATGPNLSAPTGTEAD